jgi:heat shock protein HtpX
MEMCIDNPRTGFSNVFDTHPSVDARVAALVKFAGGHDPGPLALAAPEQPAQIESAPPAGGPWSGEPPAAPGAPSTGGPSASGPWDGATPDAGNPGPWGPRRG